MRYLLISILAFALTACGTTGSKIDVAIQKNLPAICAQATSAHEAFAIVAATGDIKQKTIDKEAAAWSAIQVACSNPGNVTAANALVLAATAYATISVAMREAKR